MKTIAIISGGNIDSDFASSFMKEHEMDVIIGVDRGMEFLKAHNWIPDYIVGDFDSAHKETVAFFEEKGVKTQRLNPRKDQTDTQIGLELAIELGGSPIYILGGTGSRLDHTIGNIQILEIAMNKGRECYLLDTNNRIRMVNSRTVMEKSTQYGKYVSLISHTTNVEGLTVEGFAYPLSQYTLHCSHAIGISNEIIENKGIISFNRGILIIIESRD